MFITLTIDTNLAKRSGFKARRKFQSNLAQGWRKAVHVKKRTVWDKLKTYRKAMRDRQYAFGGKVSTI